jgi:non-heme Fe2+,alpha-ketoglutarate-dependent halogenase
VESELALFHRDGYLGPRPLADPAAFDRLRSRAGALIATGSALTGHGTYARHLDSPEVYQACVDSAILGCLRELVGPDLLLWNSSFWKVPPASVRTPWHQDALYWPTAFTLTCWIALTDVTEDSGCLTVAPGSHAQLAPTIECGPDGKFERAAEQAYVDRWPHRPIPMPAGNFVVLSDRILHASSPNNAEADRVALAVRFTIPSMRVYSDRLPLFEGHHSILVSGSDRFGLNKLGEPPRPRRPRSLSAPA